MVLQDASVFIRKSQWLAAAPLFMNILLLSGGALTAETAAFPVHKNHSTRLLNCQSV
jgi:hypothetical protein